MGAGIRPACTPRTAKQKTGSFIMNDTASPSGTCRRKPHRLRRTALCCALTASMALPPAGFAAPLSLSTAPAGTIYKLPAPNVIVSVDDSGSMEASGIATLKNALEQTFSATNLEDGEIRLAWQSMHRCDGIPSNSAACGNRNALRVFSGAHRTNFMTWVGTLTHDGGTPSHKMVRNAGDYLRKTGLGIDSPWASDPGVKEEPVLSCRKSYHLFMTDGGWNGSATSTSTVVDGNRNLEGYRSSEIGGGNIDGTARTLGDGTSLYTPNTAQTRIYSDAWGFSDSGSNYGLNTLSDLAFYYWATDLQPGIPNELKPSIRKSGDETFSSAGSTVNVAEFWNPRNDPATWQHLVTYAIGFGDGASTWTGAPQWGSDTHAGNGYSSLMLGTATWPSPLCNGNNACDGAAPYGSRDNERRIELWHMAINGRGKFVPAPNAQSLVTAFKDILNEIVTDQTQPVTSLAASATTTRAASTLYSAGYKSADWSGSVEARAVEAGTGVPAASAAWNTAALMDSTSFSPTQRLVLSQKTVLGARQAIAWRWDQLSPAQQAELNTVDGTTDALGAARLDFLRGDRSREGSPFRTRASRHGDIVNSRLWLMPGKPASGYVKDAYATFRANQASRPPMVYVGANDGMLHGFDAGNGAERIAYVPEGLHARLPALTAANYQHRFYVDGSPFTGDLYHTADGSGTGAGGSWKTYLAGFPGAGGKGYFVLDVTDPANFTTASVILDNTASADADIGHVTGEPATDPTYASTAQQITRLNNGRWALVLGNGYNSTDEKAVLLIQYLDGARELVKITADAAVGGGNGLSTPRLLDLNGDRKADVAYAGDLKGNLWKFDLSSASAADWGVAFSGAPLFTAAIGSSAAIAQPITAAPVWQSHPKGGLMIVFGTGRNLTDGDRIDTGGQSVYGIHDSSLAAIDNSTGLIDSISGGTAVTGGREALQEQTFSSTSTATASGGAALWTVSTNEVDETRRGWYIDLAQNSGERVVENLSWYEGNLIDIPTAVPARANDTKQETCEPASAAEQRFLLTINAVNGNAPRTQIYGYSASGAPSTDSTSAPSYTRSGLRIGLKKTDGDEACVPPPGQTSCEGRKGLGTLQLRASWRQLQ
jgi:type IV pilus assembly protein PilY1